MKNIVIAGLGLHARHHHYLILEKYREQYGINVKLVIDLKDQEKVICDYINRRSLKPEKTLFLDTKNRINDGLPMEAVEALKEIHERDGIDGIIVSTEPKSHKPYMLWAIRNNIDLIVDKPMTAPVLDNTDYKSARKIFEDYLEIESELKKSKSKVALLAPRRKHKGYELVKNYLEEFVDEYKVPITFVDIYHSEGMWNMPDEFFYRENHPYKYGYGLMLHSGYHYIDAFIWLSEVNNRLEEHAPDTLELVTKHSSTVDFMNQVKNFSYSKLFASNKFEPYFKPEVLKKAKSLGETDLSLICQTKKNGIVKTTGTINLLQTSFSRRAWTELPKDTYKKNGRVRHERLNIQVGHLLNIQAHNYSSGDEQSYEDTKGSLKPDNFNIMIYRNSGLVGGKPYELISLEDECCREINGVKYKTSLFGTARENLIVNWLDGLTSESDFYSHKTTVEFLSKIYESIFRQNCGLESQESMIL